MIQPTTVQTIYSKLSPRPWDEERSNLPFWYLFKEWWMLSFQRRPFDEIIKGQLYEDEVLRKEMGFFGRRWERPLTLHSGRQGWFIRIAESRGGERIIVAALLSRFGRMFRYSHVAIKHCAEEGFYWEDMAAFLGRAYVWLCKAGSGPLMLAESIQWKRDTWGWDW